MNAEAAIDIDRLGVRYGDQWVIRDFSLQLFKGEKITLTGPSGAGKSTLLRCVLGLAVPQEGRICLFGQEMDGRRVWALRRQLAYVAQEPDLGAGTAREAIERPFTYKANDALRGNLERLPQLLAQFHLPAALLGQEMTALSGGEKQRMALVSAILLNRPVVLLDEASSALDKENKQAVAAFFQQARELTVLSVAHDTEWQRFADRVVELIPPQSPASEVKT